MARIISVRSRYGGKRKENIFQEIGEWFASLSAFTKFVTITLLLISVVALTSLGQHFTYKQKATGGSLPKDGFGLYEECSPIYDRLYSGYCDKRLQQMTTGGFTIVLNYDMLSNNSTIQDILNYGTEAQNHGMKVIWALGNNPAFFNGSNLATTFPAIAASCGSACTSNNSAFITYLVNQLKNSPATWGYYVGDELSSGVHDAWLTFSNTVHQADPLHPRLIVFGTSTNSPVPNANPNIVTFADGAEVLGQDYYPLGADFDGIGTLSQTGQMAQSVQTVVSGLGKDSAFALQAMDWQEYYPPTRCSPYPSCAPFPTYSQLLGQLTDTIQNSTPRLILEYSYFNILNSDNPSGHWTDLVNALHSLSPTATPFLPTNTPTPVIPTSIPTATPTLMDTVPPTVAITSPTNASTVSRHSTATITANASDDSKVTQVVFFVNGSAVCIDTSSPYTCDWSVPGRPGANYTLTAKATDAGNYYTISSPVNITAR